MPSLSLHNFLGFVCGLAVFSAATATAQIISYRYDGVYVGAAKLSPGLSDPSCPVLPLTRIDIENGILRAWDDDGRQTVKGFVTGSGFFNADYYFPGAQGLVFEGRIDAGGNLIGGVINGDCAFVVDFWKSL